MSVSNACVIKDTPEAKACGKDRFTTVTVAYTFMSPMSDRHIFDLDMCEDHAKALEHKVKLELAQFQAGS